MKIVTYCSVFAFLILISFPFTAEAFSRRVHRSEVVQNEAPLTTVNETTQDPDRTPQGVPEPSALLLMLIGISLIAIYSMKKLPRKQDPTSNK